MKVQWVKYKDYAGAKAIGNTKYAPSEPFGPWTKIMGVVARSEGNHDTFISYDETGVTWGFLQWTMKSGRLQRLLESMKSIPYYDFENEIPATDESQEFTLFDHICCNGNGKQIFQKYDFSIQGGSFVSFKHGPLNPSKPKERKLIVDTCMGRTTYPSSKTKQKEFAISLAKEFCNMGKKFGVAEAQIDFAKSEFKRNMTYTRKNMPKYGSIGNMLDGTWDTPLPALFFNLWQNGPTMAQKIFDKNVIAKDKNLEPNFVFDKMWKKICLSRYANWGWNSKLYLNGQVSKPRVVRIHKAIKEFYGFDLPLHKRGLK